MKEILNKIASIRELVTASAKDNKALTDQMEEIKKAQGELAIAFDKNTNDLKEKELVIASQNERIMELESDKFVSDCKNEVAKKTAELAIAKQKESEEKNRREKAISEKGIKSGTVVNKLMSLASVQEFDENLAIIVTAMEEANKNAKAMVQAAIVKDQDNIDISGEMNLNIKGSPEQEMSKMAKNIK